MSISDLLNSYNALFWHYLDLSMLDPGGQNTVRYFINSPLKIDDNVLFALYVYLISYSIIMILYSYFF